MKDANQEYVRMKDATQKVNAKRVTKRRPSAPRTADEQELIDACLNLACALNWRRATRGNPDKPAVVQNETSLLKEVATGLLMAIQVQRYW